MDSVKECLSNNRTVQCVLAGAVGVISLHYVVTKIRNRPGKGNSGEVVTAPPGTVVLHQIKRGLYAPSLSPFPIKLEMFLRLAKIPYVNDFKNPMSPKTSKVPWMTYNGEDVTDSQLCIHFLQEKLGLDVNHSLTLEQRGAARAIQVLVDEHMYWPLVYFRWAHGPIANVVRQHFPMPFFVMWMVKRMVRKQLYGQGMGRHSWEDILGFLVDDLTAVDNYLGDKRYMMGDEVTEVDCSVFGMLVQFVYNMDDPVTKDLVKNKFPRLVAYVERVKTAMWPDWDDVIAQGKKK